MHNCGVRDIVLNRFGNYLSNRKQYVIVDGVSSSESAVDCGVPQGSVLGPLLFLIYMDDIQYCLYNANLYLFADDTNLFVCGRTLDTVMAKANSSVKDLVLWFQVNRLSVNLDKTCYSIFGHSDVSDSLELKIGTTVLKCVTTCKYLGIIIDDKLSWNDHIDYVYKKIAKFTSIFYRIRHRLSGELLKMLYYAFVHSHLSYGVETVSYTHLTLPTTPYV